MKSVAFLIVFAAAWQLNLFAQSATSSSFAAEIPKAWDDEALNSMELPLAGLGQPATYVPSEYYYRMPVRKIYKTYPVDVEGQDSAAYLEWLKQREPEVVFDQSKLSTEADWIRAGRFVWESVISPTERPLSASLHPLARRERRYVIREKGHVESGLTTCLECHTRYLSDGTIIVGAQGKFFDGSLESRRRQVAQPGFTARLKSVLFLALSVPWLNPDPAERLKQLSADQLAELLAAPISGTFPRARTSRFLPPVVSDLIGIRERKYLDATGLVRHRSIADLMRYAAIITGAERLSHYDGFRPYGELPDPSTLERFSDEQLYALALYIYSLKPPPNPNKFDAVAARGEEVFKREGCESCHAPPLYTSNVLTPAAGFDVPDEHKEKFEIMPVVVGTDPHLALETRKGTGYYRVPSLKGVWYRGPFEHNGSVATLEDWFDPTRLRDDYVPTGFKGLDVQTRAVKGHEYGLKLSSDDKRALIAFLKTL